MELLKQRILQDGRCFPGGILKVDSFINHQMDPMLLYKVAEEFIYRFRDADINKIVTIEASGIGTRCAERSGRACRKPCHYRQPGKLHDHHPLMI